jgi:hypothetical protein
LMNILLRQYLQYFNILWAHETWRIGHWSKVIIFACVRVFVLVFTVLKVLKIVTKLRLVYILQHMFMSDENSLCFLHLLLRNQHLYHVCQSLFIFPK